MTSNAPSLSFQHIEAELRLFHGADSLAALARELTRNRCSKAAVICGGSVSRSAAMELLRKALGPLLAGECIAVRAHSPVPAVEEAARFLDAVKADCVIAVGGGSAAVTARAASILLAEKRPAQALCTQRTADGRFESPRLGAPKLPQFVVPTTPSTACVKAGSAIHDPVSGQRLALFDPKTRAKGIFVHPDFLRTAPAELVLGSGLNTLSTAIEALESPKRDPLSEAALMHALRLTAEHLPGPLDEDVGARERLVLAAVLCGRGTEQPGGGLASVLAHAVGARSHVSNGLVNAIVLPHTMRYNAPATIDGSARIVDALGHAGGAATDSSGAVEAVEALLAKLPIPRRLRNIGVAREDLPSVAQAALSDWFISRASRRVDGAPTLVAILEAAW